MSELKSTAIRRNIKEITNFFEQTVCSHDLVYDKGLTKEIALAEIEKIRLLMKEASPFSIAFVGEYSSGKTTIIGLLTGNSLNVGTDVTTEKAYKLQWNDITLIDTPGLGSGYEEHDRITEGWLAGADLLVYVLTPDLFTSQSGQRFKEMLDKYKRDHELMLVLNMIDEEDNPVEVYQEELQRAIAPRLLEDYVPTFISAKYKEESFLEKFSLEEREWLAENSGFNHFIENLNYFVLSRKEKASLTTPLTLLHSLFSRVRFKSEFDKEESLLNWRMQTYESALHRLKGERSDFRDKVDDYAKAASGDILSALDSPPSNFEGFVTEKFDAFEVNVRRCLERLTEDVAAIFDELQKEGFEIEGSKLNQEVQSRIAHSERLRKIFATINLNSGNHRKEWTWESLRDRLIEFERLSGTKLSDDWKQVLASRNFGEVAAKLVGKINKSMVLKVGHALGHKFRPWEATKMTRWIGSAAPFLNVAGAGLELLSRHRTKKKEEEARQQLMEFKRQLNQIVNEAAGEAVTAINRDLLDPCERLLGETLRALREQKKKLSEYSKDNEAISLELAEKQEECLLLYDEIYGTV